MHLDHLFRLVITLIFKLARGNLGIKKTSSAKLVIKYWRVFFWLIHFVNKYWDSGLILIQSPRIFHLASVLQWIGRQFIIQWIVERNTFLLKYLYFLYFFYTFFEFVAVLHLACAISLGTFVVLSKHKFRDFFCLPVHNLMPGFCGSSWQKMQRWNRSNHIRRVSNSSEKLGMLWQLLLLQVAVF